MLARLENAGAYSKFIVAILAAVASILSVYFGSALWEPSVLAALGALAVYLVPNQVNNN